MTSEKYPPKHERIIPVVGDYLQIACMKQVRWSVGTGSFGLREVPNGGVAINEVGHSRDTREYR